MQLTPLIAFHISCAITATAIGPVALWARRSGNARPVLHRAAGYVFVVAMVCTAVSAFFIRDFKRFNFAGFTPVHLLIPLTLLGLFGAFWHLRHQRVAQHRSIMRKIYFGACVAAGLFTLVPGRLLGDLLWKQLA